MFKPLFAFVKIASLAPKLTVLGGQSALSAVQNLQRVLHFLNNFFDLSLLDCLLRGLSRRLSVFKFFFLCFFLTVATTLCFLRTGLSWLFLFLSEYGVVIGVGVCIFLLRRLRLLFFCLVDVHLFFLFLFAFRGLRCVALSLTWICLLDLLKLFVRTLHTY